MERKPTAKPSQESGPETRKRIIIRKTRMTATRMCVCVGGGGGGRAKRTNKKAGAVKTPLLVLPYPKKVIQALKKYTWNVRQNLRRYVKSLLIICNTDIGQTPTKTNILKICVTGM